MTYTAHITCKNCNHLSEHEIEKGKPVKEYLDPNTREGFGDSRPKCPNCECALVNCH